MKVNGQTKPSQLDRLEALEKNTETLSMGVRVSQMLVKQVMERMQQTQEMLHIKSSALSDLQYRLLALQKVTGVDLALVQTEADRLKLEEWDRASKEDSAARGLVKSDEVSSKQSIVVFTSTTPDLPEDRGVFRSKVRVVELGSVPVMEAFEGKRPGDVFEVNLADQKHQVTLLEVYEEPKQEAVSE